MSSACSAALVGISLQWLLVSHRNRLQFLCLLPLTCAIVVGLFSASATQRQAGTAGLTAEATPAPPDQQERALPAPAGAPLPSQVERPGVMKVLTDAAQHQGLDPNLLLAVSFWESGWHQDRVSSEGAVGLLQVMPKTAATAGPSLLGRLVNINDPADNAEVGAALLRDLLNKYDRRTALAAYYQGEPALLSGTYAPDTWHYADSILALRNDIAAGTGPAAP